MRCRTTTELKGASYTGWPHGNNKMALRMIRITMSCSRTSANLHSYRNCYGPAASLGQALDRQARRRRSRPWSFPRGAILAQNLQDPPQQLLTQRESVQRQCSVSLCNDATSPCMRQINQFY